MKLWFSFLLLCFVVENLSQETNNDSFAPESSFIHKRAYDCGNIEVVSSMTTLYRSLDSSNSFRSELPGCTGTEGNSPFVFFSYTPQLVAASTAVTFQVKSDFFQATVQVFNSCIVPQCGTFDAGTGITRVYNPVPGVELILVVFNQDGNTPTNGAFVLYVSEETISSVNNGIATAESINFGQTVPTTYTGYSNVMRSTYPSCSVNLPIVPVLTFTLVTSASAPGHLVTFFAYNQNIDFQIYILDAGDLICTPNDIISVASVGVFDLPTGTQLFIVASLRESENQRMGNFIFIAYETEGLAPNPFCSVSIALDPAPSSYVGSPNISPLLRSSMPLCGPFRGESNPVFFSYNIILVGPNTFTRFEVAPDLFGFYPLIDVFVGSCDALQCVSSNKIQVGNRYVTLYDMIPATHLTLVVFSQNGFYPVGTVTLTVTEGAIPPNSFCDSAEVVTAGLNSGLRFASSPTLRTELPSCFSIPSTVVPVVFLKYTTTLLDDVNNLVIFQVQYSGGGEPLMDFFLGSCNSLVCFPKKIAPNLFSGSGLPGLRFGTEIIVAVYGDANYDIRDIAYQVYVSEEVFVFPEATLCINPVVLVEGVLQSNDLNNAITPASELFLCAFFTADVNAKVLFYQYTTQLDSVVEAVIHFRVKTSGFTPIIAIFDFASGNCDSLVCLATNSLTNTGDLEVRSLAPGTVILLALFDEVPGSFNLDFDIVVTERYTPIPNDRCRNAIALRIDEPYLGTTYGSSRTRSSVPSCGEPVGFSQAPIATFVYTVNASDTQVSIDTCSFQTKGVLPTFVSVFVGGVTNVCQGACNGFRECAVAPYRVSGLAQGTKLVIYVGGSTAQLYGDFYILVTERVAPANAICENAIPLKNFDSPYYATNVASPTLRSDALFPSCPTQLNNTSPIVFFKYTTQLDEVPQASVSVSFFDGIPASFELFTGGCSNLTCTTLDDNDRLVQSPFGTELIIAVNGQKDLSEGDLSVFVRESYDELPNNDCTSAVSLQPGQLYDGMTYGSPSRRYFWPSCGEPYQFDAAPVAVFNYTVTNPVGRVSIYPCLGKGAFDIPVFMSVTANSCSANCLGFLDCQTEFEFVTTQPLGTVLFLMVGGTTDYDGTFSIQVNETDARPANRNCSTAVTLYNLAPTPGNNLYSNTNRSVLPSCGASLNGTETGLVFYRFTTTLDGVPQANVYVQIDNSPSLIDFTVELFDGPCGSVVCNSDTFSGVNIATAIGLPTSTNVLISVRNANNFGGAFNIIAQEFYQPLFNSYCGSALALTNGQSTDGYTYGSTSIRSDFPYCGEPTSFRSVPVATFGYNVTFTDAQIEVSACSLFVSQYAVPVFVSIFSGGCSVPVCLGFVDCSSTTSFVSEQVFGDKLIFVVGSTDVDLLGQFSIQLTETELFPPANSECSAAEPLTNLLPVAGTNKRSNTTRAALPACSDESDEIQDQALTVFYSYVTLYSGSLLSVSTCQSTSDFDSYISVFIGNSCGNLTCSNWDDNSCGNGHAFVDLTEAVLPLGTLLTIAVQGKGATFGAFSVLVEEIEATVAPNQACETAIALTNFQTEKSNTYFSSRPRSDLPACRTDASGSLSHALFYSYTTKWEYSEITFDTCRSTYDSSVLVFQGNCSELTCLGTTNTGCNHALLLLERDQRVPKGTTLFVAVAGKTDSDNGGFELLTQESGTTPQANARCDTATVLINGRNVTGSVAGSGTLRSSLPVCKKEEALIEPSVFYSYIPTKENSAITITACGSKGFLAPSVAVFQGPCGSSTCFVSMAGPTKGCTVITIPKGAGLLQGDPITVAVYSGQPAQFSVSLVERQSCSVSGPLFPCSLRTLTLPADILCSTNSSRQCAVMPFVPLGDCQDPNEGCDCSVAQIDGPKEGDELSEGEYLVRTVATNAEGYDSPVCVTTITVSPLCFETGPQVQCTVTSLDLYANPRCRLDNNAQCAVFNQFSALTCTEKRGCECQETQLSGPLPGQKLGAGNYSVVRSAISQSGLSSMGQCEVQIAVHDSCNPNGPTLTCPPSQQISTSPFCKTAEGLQCAEMPYLGLGQCSDFDSCDCLVTQGAAPAPGDSIVAGEYTVFQSAMSEAGLTDSCSTTIIVEDYCNSFGPAIQNCLSNLRLPVTFDCFLATGRACAVVPALPSPVCVDRCGCSFEHISGPVAGSVLVAGEYQSTTRATDEAGFTQDCVTRIVVAGEAPSISATPTPSPFQPVFDYWDFSTLNSISDGNSPPPPTDPSQTSVTIQVQLNCDGVCTDTYINQYINALAADLGLNPSEITLLSASGNILTISICCRTDIVNDVQNVFKPPTANQKAFGAALLRVVPVYDNVDEPYFDSTEDRVIVRSAASCLSFGGLFVFLALFSLLV